MIGNIVCNFEYGISKISPQTIVSKAVPLLGIVFFSFIPNMAQAQHSRPSLEESSSPSNRISPNRSNYVSPIRQRNLYPNSGGSQKFFRQGNDDLYFLPENRSEPILQIDEDLETEAPKTEEQPKEVLDE